MTEVERLERMAAACHTLLEVREHQQHERTSVSSSNAQLGSAADFPLHTAIVCALPVMRASV